MFILCYLLTSGHASCNAFSELQQGFQCTMSVTRKLKQCRLIALCYCFVSYVSVLAFVLSFPTSVLKNGSPVLVWTSGYSLIVCMFSHYLVKRVWYTRPKFFSLVVITVIGVSTLFSSIICTWSFLFYCGGYIHGVRFWLSQQAENVDVTERLAVTTTVGFVASICELFFILLIYFLYQRLNLDWAKAVVWLRKDSQDRPSPCTQYAEKYGCYNDHHKGILEGDLPAAQLTPKHAAF